MRTSADRIVFAADPAEFDAAVAKNKIACPKCKGELGLVRRFNMMFQVGIGPDGEAAYLRPETCQSIFVDFPRLFKTMRGKLPMGVAQVGKSFRNEISPRQGLLRLREFYQAEIEVFCNPSSLDSVPGWEEVSDTKIILEIDGSKSTTTCAAAVESGLLPNRALIYNYTPQAPTTRCSFLPQNQTLIRHKTSFSPSLRNLVFAISMPVFP